MTLDQLRGAFWRTLSAHGITPYMEFVDELASIADHHAAEEAAAAWSEATTTPA